MINFEKLSPSPFTLVSPVCPRQEPIATEHLVNLVIGGDLPMIYHGNVSYGVNLARLETISATYITMRKPYHVSLVINSPGMREIEGMFTGTSDRRRIYRPLVGLAVPGKWEVGDCNLIKKLELLRTEKQIDLISVMSDYYHLLATLFRLLGIEDKVGPSFQQNIFDYSTQLEKKMGVLIN